MLDLGWSACAAHHSEVAEQHTFSSDIYHLIGKYYSVRIRGYNFYKTTQIYILSPKQNVCLLIAIYQMVLI